MNRSRLAGLGFPIAALALLGFQPAAAAERSPGQPVALVYALAGEATVTAPAQTGRPLRLFERLPARTAVEVGAGSSLALAFANGRRYELGERSRVTLGPKDLTSRAGLVTPLPRVPPLPPLAAIADDERPGRRAGAVPIRSRGIDLLSPWDGAAVLAAATVLHFRPAAGAARHRVEVEDSRGNVIFGTVAEASEVTLPAGLLEPGRRYHWTVTALDSPGPAVSGAAGFVTLSREAAAARERLRKAVEASPDDGLRALLAAVDRSLGLAGPPAGLEVEAVAPGLAGDKAGLRPGDVILSWSSAASPPAFPAPAGGEVSFPFDLLPVQGEEAPRRGVTLRGRRGDQQMFWTLTASDWAIELRPHLPAGVAALYLEGRAALDARDLTAVRRSWLAAADAASAAGDDRFATWLLHRLAKRLGRAGEWAEADVAFGAALAAWERIALPQAASQIHCDWGHTFEARSDWGRAIELYRKALAFDRLTAARSLAEVRTLNGMGVAMAKSGDFATAGEVLRQALSLGEALAPWSTEVMASLNNLGILARRSGDLAAAADYLTRAEELQRRLAPDAADHALNFQNLGNLAQDRGDLEGAAAFHRRALAIFERIAPDGEGVMHCLGNLALVAMEQGDLATADDLLRRSLVLGEPLGDELENARNLINLGNVAARRGDLEAAEDYYRRALAIHERLSPEGPELSYSLVSLGNLASQQGDFAKARTYLRQGLEIDERLIPGTLEIAATLESLGRFEMDSGDLAAAEGYLRRALAIFDEKSPASLEASQSLGGLGEVVLRRGRLPEALALHRRALALQQKLAPGTTGEAKALHLLGQAERRAGRHEEGTRNLCRAIDVLDRQRGRIGGTPEARSSFEASIGSYYSSCLEGLVRLGRHAEAFHVLERARARSFLALLAERDLRHSGLSPELAAERRRLAAEYDEVQSQLARLGAGQDAEAARLTGSLRDLRAQQEEIFARIRREAPRFAALHDPAPLDLAGARAALDSGTVLLAYVLGAEKAWLFVVQPADVKGQGLSVHELTAGPRALREEVESFRRLLGRSSSDPAALRERARRLYDLLIRPAEGTISRARRLLLSPDGPLHTLPFAALLRGERYLVEGKPLHTVLSATVYAELTRSRPARGNPGEERLAAFGDPVYPPASAGPADPEIREALRRGLDLKPLPSTRQEVEALAGLYPGAEVYLGRDATEERARSLRPDARLVHFACHGLLDERFPLNSALALSVPEPRAEGQPNGLLQAWEIFESVRLDADLVTLSACDTALGREMGGEGLLGLTRAFQYAGARTVFGSLWSVADDSTAGFMKRFYGYLRVGKPKDEALRAAQIDQIRMKSNTSHPFHWAAFQLAGDWR